jgi:hypothetical protein
MTRFATSFFCFAQDVLDAGIPAFCDAVERAGVTGITVAVSYHQSRDFRPRQQDRRVEELPAGALYFAPRGDLYEECGIAPWSPEPFASGELLDELGAETARRGLDLGAWTVFGFNERIGRAHPELAQVNAYGDRYATDLCPANPRVRSYFLGLARDVTRLRPTRLVAESLHFHPLRIGRRFFELDAASELALGLCFCDSCRAAVEARDVDFCAVRDWARSTADRAFAGLPLGAGTLDPSEVAALASGELGPFLDARADIVANLVADVAGIVATNGGELAYLDQVGAETPLIHGSMVDDAIRFGVDVARIGQTCPEYFVLGYTPTAEGVAAAVAAYRAALPDFVDIHVTLRPSWPDCADDDNLAAKLAAARDLGAVGAHFYHYGLLPDSAIERVATVLGRAA